MGFFDMRTQMAHENSDPMDSNMQKKPEKKNEHEKFDSIVNISLIASVIGAATSVVAALFLANH